MPFSRIVRVLNANVILVICIQIINLVNCIVQISSDCGGIKGISILYSFLSKSTQLLINCRHFADADAGFLHVLQRVLCGLQGSRSCECFDDLLCCSSGTTNPVLHIYNHQVSLLQRIRKTCIIKPMWSKVFTRPRSERDSALLY